MATSDADGNCDASPKGDPAGQLVHVIDDRTIAIAERPGNKRADGYKNILVNPHVGLNFLIPGRGDTLRINGRARLVSDAPFFDEMVVKGHRPLLAVVVEIDDIFFHCAKAFLRSGLWKPETWEPGGEGPAARGDRQGGRADRHDRRAARRLLRAGELRQGALRLMRLRRFLKGHGTENDFVLLPDLDGTVHGELCRASGSRALCDRRAGIGGDGVLRVRALDGPDGPTARVVHGLPQLRRLALGDVRQRHPGVRPLPGRRGPRRRVRTDPGRHPRRRQDAARSTAT